MTPPKPLGLVMNELAVHLEHAARSDALRRQLIDDMTHNMYTQRGTPQDAPQAPSDADLSSINERIRRAAAQITILAPTHTRESYVARPAQDVPTSGDRLTPKAFLEAYELLFVEVFGSGAIVQDDTHIHGSGKAKRGRTASDQVETRGGAIQKKKLSASQKNVIKSQRAFNEKTKIDKRLRKLGKEIYEWLSKEQTAPTEFYLRCGKCKKHAEDDWLHCPRCGHQTERVYK